MRGGDVYFCPLNRGQHLFMPLRNVWLRENKKSNSSGLEIVVAETFFSRNQKMSLLHVLQGPAKRGFTRAEGSTQAKTGSTWILTCIAFTTVTLDTLGASRLLSRGLEVECHWSLFGCFLSGEGVTHSLTTHVWYARSRHHWSFILTHSRTLSQWSPSRD